jgi:deoxyribodipyrimidine photo-lyase
LAWQAHFIQKLETWPQIEKQSTHPFFDLPEHAPRHDPAHEIAFARARTGYPLVDACLRCLHATGWLPFRMRAMLVAFARYDLDLNWRWTAHFLARCFTDYEPGIHYAQIHMQSGITGINVPRMYDPVKQSRQLDPHGQFIRTYLPELNVLPDSWIHAPWEIPPLLQLEHSLMPGKDFVLPIVNHPEAIQRARKHLQKVRHMDGFRHEAERAYIALGSRKKTR